MPRPLAPLLDPVSDGDGPPLVLVADNVGGGGDAPVAVTSGGLMPVGGAESKASVSVGTEPRKVKVELAMSRLYASSWAGEPGVGDASDMTASIPSQE